MEQEHRDSIAARSKERAKRAHIRVFQGFEAENAAETDRRAAMTVADRMAEFAAIRKRVYGAALDEPMQKVATWEYIEWC